MDKEDKTDTEIKTDKDAVKEGMKMPALAPVKKKLGLTPKKKEELKQMMGKYSGKASLSLLNEINRNETN